MEGPPAGTRNLALVIGMLLGLAAAGPATAQSPE